MPSSQPALFTRHVCRHRNHYLLADYYLDQRVPARQEWLVADAGQDLLAILRKIKGKLKVDPAGRKFQEALKKEYEASLAVLLPLKARLAATDRLIDQVVYRLYRLTGDEIAVVEGR